MRFVKEPSLTCKQDKGSISLKNRNGHDLLSLRGCSVSKKSEQILVTVLLEASICTCKKIAIKHSWCKRSLSLSYILNIVPREERSLKFQWRGWVPWLDMSGKSDEFLWWGEVVCIFLLLSVAAGVTFTYLRSFKYMVRSREVQSVKHFLVGSLL